LLDDAREVIHHPVSARDLAKLSKMNERTVYRTVRQALQQPGPLSRHNALDEESEQALEAMFLEALRAAVPMNKKQLLHIVQERYRKTATWGWVKAFIGRHLDALQTCRSIPEDDTRLAVPMSQLEEHLHILQVHFAGKCTERVFNLDELGSADCEDRKMKKVIAPAAVRRENVYRSVSRGPRHMTLLTYVSAPRDAGTPMVITTKPVRTSLWSRSVRQNEDVIICRRTPAYIDEELFFEYITSILISYVDAGRSRAGLETETAILLMDSALPHTSNRILRILGEKNIVAITFPAHTTNLFQAL
jgi:hypothetical protein